MDKTFLIVAIRHSGRLKRGSNLSRLTFMSLKELKQIYKETCILNRQVRL